MEDIPFLLQNSERESYLFQTDSGNRDKQAWPTPSQYDVVFDSPFKYVVGLDIIDASVPRTQYSVDAHNNRLSISVNGGEFIDVRIDVGDHTDSSIVDELNRLLRDDYNIIVSAQSNPASLKNAIKFTSTVPFMLDMERSTCQGVLGFNELASNNTRRDSWFVCPDPINSPRTFASKSSTPVSMNAYVGSTSTDGFLDVAETHQYVAQRILTTTSGLLAQVRAAFRVQGRLSIDTVEWYLSDIDPVTGNPSESVVAQGTIKPVDYFVLGSTNSGQSTSQDIRAENIVLAASRYYWLKFKIMDPNIAIYFGQETPPGNILLSADNAAWTETDPVSGLDIIGNTVCSILITQTVETIRAPGILNLTGEPYVMLRIPQIESHMHRSRAYEKHSFGSAKFSLGVVGYANDRFDYASIPPRTFHPIGKLDRLTLRFVTSTGLLYDFKGVEHQLIVVIRYLQPKQKEPFNTRLLNPEYEPDDLARLRNMKSVDDTDSDDDPDQVALMEDDENLREDGELDDTEAKHLAALRDLESGLYRTYFTR